MESLSQKDKAVCDNRDKTVDLDALTRGERRAWGAFMDRFSPVVYSAVWRTLRSHALHVDGADVDDIVQQAFCGLVERNYRRLRSYSPKRASLVTYLTVIARTTALQALRRRRLSTIPLEDAHKELPEEPPPPDGRPRIPYDLLPPRQKLVLHLMFEEEMKVAEIAAQLAITAQTVRSLKHEAVKKLRKFMKEQMPTNGR